MITAIGGRFERRNSDYYTKLISKTLPEFALCIARDKVCRKIVTYDCEPLLSPEDEAEIIEVAGA